MTTATTLVPSPISLSCRGLDSTKSPVVHRLASGSGEASRDASLTELSQWAADDSHRNDLSSPRSGTLTAQPHKLQAFPGGRRTETLASSRGNCPRDLASFAQVGLDGQRRPRLEVTTQLLAWALVRRPTDIPLCVEKNSASSKKICRGLITRQGKLAWATGGDPSDHSGYLSLRNLLSNPFNCNCHLAWLGRWLRKRRIVSGNPRCQKPFFLKEIPIQDVAIQDFTCEGKRA